MALGKNIWNLKNARVRSYPEQYPAHKRIASSGCVNRVGFNTSNPASEFLYKTLSYDVIVSQRKNVYVGSSEFMLDVISFKYLGLLVI